MVGNAILRKIVRSYSLRSVARADHRPAFVLTILVRLSLVELINAASQDTPGLGAILVLALFVPHAHCNSRRDMLQLDCTV